MLRDAYMTHPADTYMRARDVACASVGTPRECMGAPQASGRWDHTSEHSEGRACTSSGRAWAWWMRAWGSSGHTHGQAWGSGGHGRVGIQRAQMGMRGDPVGTGVRGSSGHGRACVGIHRAWVSSRNGRVMIQQARTWACKDPASMNDGVVIPHASKRSV